MKAGDFSFDGSFPEFMLTLKTHSEPWKLCVNPVILIHPLACSSSSSSGGTGGLQIPGCLGRSDGRADASTCPEAELVSPTHHHAGPESTTRRKGAHYASCGMTRELHLGQESKAPYDALVDDLARSRGGLCCEEGTPKSIRAPGP